MKRLLLLAALLGLTSSASAQIVWDGNGILGSSTGGFLPAFTIMADTGLMVLGDTGDHKPGTWAVLAKCNGIPVSSPLVGGAGIYTLERYNATSVLKVQLLDHVTMNSDALPSIPPITLAVGEGLRIRTLVPLQGLLSCSIWRYAVVP